MARYGAVIINRKASEIDRIFHYVIPDSLESRAYLGSVVSVPFGRGNQCLEGVIVGLSQEKPEGIPEGRLKCIVEVVSSRPLFTKEMLALSQWISKYYACPWAAVLQAMLPAGLALSGNIIKNKPVRKYSPLPLAEDAKLTPKQWRAYEFLNGSPKTLKELQEAGFSRDICQRMLDKGFLELLEIAVSSPGGQWIVEDTELNPEQQRAYELIKQEMQGEGRPFLLWGITGSGKTEVYARLLEDMIREGRQAILLIPEIALTTQTLSFLQKRLNQPLAVLHSGLTPTERRKVWESIALGEYPVVVGARSAVFAPLPCLGMIIIDEEHETSYKQDNAPRFHSRDVALERCRLSGAQLVLGSATPGVESVYRARRKEYAYAVLRNRFYGAALPQTHIVDMREELRRGNRSLFSQVFQEGIKDRLAKSQQTLVLINRRGYFTFFSCRECGHVIICPHCSIPMAYHGAEDSLKCHYCGNKQQVYRACPACGSPAIRSFGTGTQRVEAELGKLFPGAVIARLDYDSARKKGYYGEVYQRMLNNQIDILVGTQMIAKGLDFPNVTLAGVLSADMTLNLPDLRASERTFQLINQLLGRSGRRDKQGSAVIQTYNPDSIPIKAAASQDYKAFYNAELAFRKEHQYPPYISMIRVIINGKYQVTAMEAANSLAAELRESLPSELVFGATPAPWEKIKDRFRWVILLKNQDLDCLRQILESSIHKLKGNWHKDVYVQIDVDPYSFM